MFDHKRTGFGSGILSIILLCFLLFGHHARAESRVQMTPGILAYVSPPKVAPKLPETKKVAQTRIWGEWMKEHKTAIAVFAAVRIVLLAVTIAHYTM